MRLLYFFLLAPTYLLAQGLRPDEGRYQSLPQKRAAGAVTQLPSRVDLSAYAPSVIDQGAQNTCVGVAVGYYLRTMLEARRRNLTDRKAIDRLRFSPSYLYNQIKDADDNTCMAGAEIEKALTYLTQNGLPTLAQQPYPNCQPTQAALPAAPDSRLLDYARLFGLLDSGAEKVLATKKALSESSPVVVGVQLTGSMGDLSFRNSLFSRMGAGLGRSSARANFMQWQPTQSATLTFGHAMCVVGYDDAMFGTGAFKLINSWGSSWGDGGYFWIAYPDYDQFAKYGYQAYVQPLTTPNANTIVLQADVSIALGTFVTDTEVAFDRTRPGAGLTAYTIRQPQRTGTPFTFTTNVSRQTYLYLLAANATDSVVTKLFPEAGISPLIGPNSQVMLPRDRLLTLLGNTGQEYWVFLFSETALDIDGYMQKINTQTGAFPARVQAAFGSALAPWQQVDYKDKKMGFFLKSQYRGRVVPLMVSMTHVR
jgi:hypothetical protein